MEQILESLRRIIYRWVNTATYLTADIPAGATQVSVENTTRFRAGDEITIRDMESGEYPTILINEVIDKYTLSLASPVQFPWTMAQGAMVQKTYMGMFIQGIYINEQEVIPRFPAIEIVPISENSEWMTFGTTKERRNFEINIYVEQETKENGLRFIMRLAEMIRKGLKKNIFPLVGSYETITVLADIAEGDEFFRIENTDSLQSKQLIVVEDSFKAESFEVCGVLDGTTIQVYPLAHNDFATEDNTKVIVLSRFLFNSWPSETQYGIVSKGTLLQGAKIQWFCEEQEVQTRGGWSDPSIS